MKYLLHGYIIFINAFKIYFCLVGVCWTRDDDGIGMQNALFFVSFNKAIKITVEIILKSFSVIVKRQLRNYINIIGYIRNEMLIN